MLVPTERLVTLIGPVRHESKEGASHLPDFALCHPKIVCAFQHCCQNKHIRWHRQSQACLSHPREGYYLRKPAILPQTPWHDIIVYRHLKAFQGVMSSERLIWSFNSRLWFTMQAGRHSHCSWPWPQHLTGHQSPRRCVLRTTRRSRHGEEAFMNSSLQQQEEPSAPQVPDAARAGSEQMSSHKQWETWFGVWVRNQSGGVSPDCRRQK